VPKGRFIKGIYTLGYRPNVPLEVFSGEATPNPGMGSPNITEALPKFSWIFLDKKDRIVLVCGIVIVIT
jgi:hypothetical protein